jgi:histidine ammonia-lyase
MSDQREIRIDGASLTLDDVRCVARGEARAVLADEALPAIRRSRAIVERIVASDEVVYSVNTGFGALSDVVIPPEDVRSLQLRLIRSHAAGTGAPLSAEVTRAMMLLRANTLAKGYSGVRPDVIRLLLAMLERRVHPVIPRQGSLGASGDLAPLAHLALVLVGEGSAELGGEVLEGHTALERAGLDPLTLEAKEGLALLNGTQMMTAIAVFALLETVELCKVADLAAAMSVEGFLGSHRPFRQEVWEARPHPGAFVSAANCRAILHDSALEQSHAGCKKVQDPYSFRCVPQVHGAVRDAAGFARATVEREINSATDNPLFLPATGEAVSQGNFHGEPVALAMDFLGIALAELGSIAERRIDKLNDPRFSELPAFLTGGKQGLNSGTMIAHYTAASLVSENKVLAHPATIDSIPTSANKEDHVSMGSIAARKAARIARHVRHILATEVFCALQALRLRAPVEPGQGVRAATDFLDPRIAPLDDDRALAAEITEVAGWIEDGSLLAAVQGRIGPLA